MRRFGCFLLFLSSFAFEEIPEEIPEWEDWKDDLNHTCETYEDYPFLCDVAEDLAGENDYNISAKDTCDVCQEYISDDCSGVENVCDCICEGWGWTRRLGGFCRPGSETDKQTLDEAGCLNGTMFPEIDEEDRMVLQKLYDATNGDSWTEQWNMSTDLCNTALGVECDEQGKVFVLILDDSNLDGTIPTEIALLDELTVLMVENNNLYGPIPSEIGLMQNMTRLRFSHNKFDSLPSEIGNLDPLEELFFSDNNIGGTLFTEFGNLQNLRVMHGATNHFEGTLPTEYGAMANLQSILFHRNKLTGTLPSTYGNLFQLVRMIIEDNYLEGTLPTQFGYLTAIVKLSLNLNRFTGSIPTHFGLMTNLEELYLSHNMLTGEIPSEFGECDFLEYLYLNDNQLSGSLPDTLPVIIRELDLTDNELTGWLPSNLGLYTDLRILYLDRNYLVGSIPSSFGVHKNFEEIYLSHNELSGTLPSEMCSIESLSALDLSNNHFSGELLGCPNWRVITYLAFSHNSFHGQIPTVFNALTHLEELYLDGNEFSGPLPTGIQALQNSFQVIRLTSNSFDGTIPTEYGELSSLIELSLSDNAFSGKIPADILEIPTLKILNLAGNQFECPILNYETITQNDYIRYKQGDKCVGGESDVIKEMIIELHAGEWDGVDVPWLLDLIHYCDFYGIKCATPTGPITEIDIRFVGARGSIPTSIRALNLGALYLGHNDGLYCPVIDYSNWAETTDYFTAFSEEHMFDDCFYCDGTPGDNTVVVFPDSNGCSETALYGEACTAECKEGLQKISGEFSRTCGVDTNYDSLQLRCGAYCYIQPSEKLANIHHSCKDTIEYGEVCRMECDRGFIHDTDSGSLSRKCEENGDIAMAPTCRKPPYISYIVGAIFAVGVIVTAAILLTLMENSQRQMTSGNFAAVFSVLLGINDYITDCLFVTAAVTIHGGHASILVLLSILFIVVTFTVNVLCICFVYFIGFNEPRVVKHFQDFVFVMSVVSLFATTQPMGLLLLSSGLFGARGLQLRWPRGLESVIQHTSLFGLLLKNIPQITLQSMYASQTTWETIYFASVLSSALAILFEILRRTGVACMKKRNVKPATCSTRSFAAGVGVPPDGRHDVELAPESNQQYNVVEETEFD